MSKKWIGGISVVLLALTWWWALEPAWSNPRKRSDAVQQGQPAARVARLEGSIAAADEAAGGSERALLAPADREEAMVVVLHGLHQDAPWTTAVTLDLDGRNEAQQAWLEHSARAVPAADGSCSMSLPAWAATQLQKLRVRADDPAYRPLDERFDGPLPASRRLDIDVQVVATIRGRVVDEQGMPVPAACISAFAQQQGVAQDGVCAQANTAADGTFVLAVPPTTPLLLVAMAMQQASLSGMRMTGRHGAIADVGAPRPEFAPATKAAEGILGEPRDLGDLVLRAAGRITGVVCWRDGRPVPKAEVRVHPNDGGRVLTLDSRLAVQQRSDGTWTQVAGTITPLDGSFALPAAPGTAVTLAVTAVEGVWLRAKAQWPAVAPGALRLELPLPVQLRALVDGGPLAGAWFCEVEGQARAVAPTGVLSLVAERDAALQATAGGRRSAVVRVVPPMAGTTVDFELVPALGEVAIEFAGDFPVRNATFRFRRQEGGPETREQGQRDDRSGPFRFWLEPAAWIVEVEAGGGERNGLFLLPQAGAFALAAPGARASLVLPATFGGRLEVEVVDDRGLHLPGTCRIYDATRRDVSAPFTALGRTGMHGELLDGGTNTCSRVLPPGDYRLQFDLGAQGVFERTATLRGRESTRVSVRVP